MTNADVIKMADANLDVAIIETAIENAEASFDTSTEGLIALSAAKVPQPIISLMIKKGAGKSTKSSAASTAKQSAPAADDGEAMSPSEVIMIDGETATPMRYISPQVRSAARGLGFGGVASYAVMRGSAAAVRTKNRSPEFKVLVPNQAQPEAYHTLANFAVRKNNSREVMIGGGYMSYSTGIHESRVVAVTSEKDEDQSRAPKNFTLYTLKPKAPMAPGEYAVILYTGEVGGMVAGWFSGGGNSYFDFGID
jgi:hypothetical protein